MARRRPWRPLWLRPRPRPTAIPPAGVIRHIGTSTSTSDFSTPSRQQPWSERSTTARLIRPGRRGARSAETAGDVVLGALLGRVGEDPLRAVQLDHAPRGTW